MNYIFDLKYVCVNMKYVILNKSNYIQHKLYKYYKYNLRFKKKKLKT